VTLQPDYGDVGVLTTTVTTAAPPLAQLIFQAGSNVTVEVPPASPQAPPFTVTLPAGATTATFLLHQVAPGVPATVTSLQVVDACGAWQTFVGGGAATYAPTSQAFGIDFSPYMDGQDPNQNRPPTLSDSQILSRLQGIAPYTRWVRTFACGSGLQDTGMLAHSLGLKVAVGAWIDKTASDNLTQVQCLIDVLSKGQADLGIVGSEVLLRGDQSDSQLVAYMSQVKQAVPSAVVTTADTWATLLAHPSVIAAGDVVFANLYPYWEGTPEDRAVAALNTEYQSVVAAAGGKPVYVSETGWPSCGNVVDQAVPSPATASAYFLEFMSWARATNAPAFAFEAYDEAWKAAYEGPQGQCWGILDSGGHIKSGMAAPFHGQTVSDTWTLVGGPGQPAIDFTSVPPIGSGSPLKGETWHIATSSYQVAVYIHVGLGWWTKPTFANPTTPLNPDGRWTADITTGGNDTQADQVVAYLTPRSYSPPLLGGAASLPPELDQNAVAKASVTR
jgi:exo-beta-1,3-glucanase (GH17 family)